MLGLTTYVLGGLRAAGASRDAYLALLRAPFYLAWKLALAVTGRRAHPSKSTAAPEWVRTARAPMIVQASASPGTVSKEGRTP